MRYQLPVHSPLTLRAVRHAFQATLGAGGLDGASLEGVVAARFDAQRALLVDSGTTALALALRLGAPNAGPVALPAYACYNLATAADAVPHPVLLYDLDPDTLGPDEESLDRVLARGVSVLVVAPLYGFPVAMDPIIERCRRMGVVLIEDAAQHAGARWQGRAVGSFGDLSIVSFGRGKGVTAGRGGALLARGPKWLDRVAEVEGTLPRAPSGGTEAFKLGAQWLLARPALYALPAALPFLELGETIYHPPWPVGRMSAAARATLSATWHGEGEELVVRRRNAARLLRALSAAPGRDVKPVSAVRGGEPGYLRLPIVAPGRSDGRRLGVMPGYPESLGDLPRFADRVSNRSEGLPGARSLARTLRTLPVHSLLSEGDLIRLEGWVSGMGRVA